MISGPDLFQTALLRGGVPSPCASTGRPGPAGGPACPRARQPGGHHQDPGRPAKHLHLHQGPGRGAGGDRGRRTAGVHRPAQHRGVHLEGWWGGGAGHPPTQEPVPGWVDNLNGPTGLFLIAGIGVMRTAVVMEEVRGREGERPCPSDADGRSTCGHLCKPYPGGSLANIQHLEGGQAGGQGAPGPP